MKSNNTALFLFLAIITCVFGCDSTTTEEESILYGEFKGKVGESPNAGLYEELEGVAQFNFDNSDSTFNIQLVSDLISDTALTNVFFRIKSLVRPMDGVYSVSNIDEIQQVNGSEFSGFYLSQSVGLGKQYYSESGTLTIIPQEENSFGVKGVFDVIIFSKETTDSVTYTRRYTKMKGEFFASPEISR